MCQQIKKAGLDKHTENNESQPLPHTVHKNYYEWDHRHKPKSQTNKASGRKKNTSVTLGQAKISYDEKALTFIVLGKS